jgi:isopentenyl phosphate kinase
MRSNRRHNVPDPAGADHLVFVKLGGSVITDKMQPETIRPRIISCLAGDVKGAMGLRPDLQLVLGHGSGSFGHVTARRYGTRQGVSSEVQWRGFAEVAAMAAKLNRMVVDAFWTAGVPVWALQPSASARCRNGELVSLETAPIEQALDRGLVPLLYGDVALDEVLGGTIISTEEIFAFLARRLCPGKLVLVGAVDGVYDRDPLRDASAQLIPEISAANWSAVRARLGGSHGPDVTGGMLAKVEEMVGLVRALPGLTVQIISGERKGALQAALGDPHRSSGGTVIHWRDAPEYGPEEA